MRDFDALFDLAAARKGGVTALRRLLTKPKPASSLINIPDDRWLSEMTKCVFQAGFIWRVVENKWDDFEHVFYGFDVHRVAHLSDEKIEGLLANRRIIRHYAKLLSTRNNATFLLEIIDEFGSAGRYFSGFPSDQYINLLLDLKKRAYRMGGTSAQYFLRRMGKDSFLLTRDVVAALVREEVIDKTPTSKRDLRTTQSAFNSWCDQGQCSLTEVSRILALGIG
ncbi:MAG TPA: 3-methyladenine DNA glycosylase [Gammaproteobacteria bacterium]|nr:3-methyladenine DNA glycosylase [Gammaproteobacteria bacterium]|tara:strand:- start:2903 stop:3571 length:669 start_codon:yes stop_codon:yes gene_type:complete